MAAGEVNVLLKLSNSTELNKFLHECIDDLIGRKNANFNNFNCGDIEWTIEEYEKAKKYVQNFYHLCVRDGYTVLDTTVSESLQEALRNCYEIRKDEIFQDIAKDYLHNSGHNLVENLDWKLKWVLGSSSLATIKEPWLQVDFHCSRKIKGNIEKNSVNFEVNLEQVDKLIKDLTRVKNELE